MTVLVLVLAVIGTIVAAIALKRYENGLLDVCARQQDNYVQLVLDQINLEKYRSDDEIIGNILGTLNSSTSRYWTFTKGESILFVKDVMETDKYKSYTMDSYYNSESTRRFIDSLEKDRIVHDTIEVKGVEYIASGTMFTYNGNDYELCLLTNDSIFLENNDFLSAKIELIMLIVLIIALLIVIPIVLTQRNVKLAKEHEKTKKELGEFADKIVLLNARLDEQNIYDARKNLFSADLIDEFVDKLAIRKTAFPVYYVRVECTTENGEVRLLDNTNIIFGKNALRFKDRINNHIILLILAHDSLSDEERDVFFTTKHIYFIEEKCFKDIDSLRTIL